ncbi:MAG: BtpA/SgcQ family protein [Bacteroidota bacterium]
MSTAFQRIFPQARPIIGMIHLRALPGTPAYGSDDALILETALEEAALYKKAGLDALMLENMHDVPYVRRQVGPEITAMMTLVAHEVRKQTQLPCGLQILAGANRQALAVAKAADLQFIRAEGFVYGHLADEGYMDADAGELLRYRRQIEAEHIAIFTDIKKKHSAHQLTADVDIVETAQTAAYFRSDALILTGAATGQQANLNELNQVQQAVDLPVLLGSGITLDNLAVCLQADALIVGSWFKEKGHWANALSYDRVARFMDRVRQLRDST